MKLTRQVHPGCNINPFSGRSQIAVIDTPNLRADLRSAAKRSAFTLIEMVVSLTIISIVFLSMGSVMMLAGKAAPDSAEKNTLTLEALETVQQMVDELQTAKSVINASATGIEFTVPDRDNDGTDETISYIWGGTPGAPLSRKYNNNTAVYLLPSIYEFNLTYDTLDIPQTGPPVTSGEVELVSHDPAQTSKVFNVTDTNWGGQCIVPLNLPADAISWSVTRVAFNARTKDGANGVTKVQLRPTNTDHSPQSTVLEEHLMYESDLASSFTWQTFTFSSVTGLDPADALALVCEWQYDTDACEVEYNNNSGGGYLKTSNAGSSWNVDAGKSMVFYAYGTYDTPGPGSTTSQLRAVWITLTPSDDPASQARASVAALNRPTMP